MKNLLNRFWTALLCRLPFELKRKRSIFVYKVHKDRASIEGLSVSNGIKVGNIVEEKGRDSIMPYSSIQVANWLIDKAIREEVDLTPMKVQKLMFLAYGWNAGLRSEPLTDEGFQAWKYGPVAPSVYRCLKDFGGKQVDELIKVAGVEPGNAPYAPTIDGDAFTNQLLETIWEHFGRYKGVALSDITHVEGGPWHTVWSKSPDGKAPIPHDIVRDYYSRFVAEADEELSESEEIKEDGEAIGSY